MDDPTATIIAAAIGGVATIVAAYVSYIKGRGPQLSKPSSKDRGYISGRWVAQWTVTRPSERQPEYTKESVEIEVDGGGRVSGTGTNNEAGKYILTGQVWEHVITLQFKAQDDCDGRVGMVLLEKDVMNRRMSGEWIQYSSKKHTVGGTTVWERPSN